jgi:hypothetical protein
VRPREPLLHRINLDAVAVNAQEATLLQANAQQRRNTRQEAARCCCGSITLGAVAWPVRTIHTRRRMTSS